MTESSLSKSSFSMLVVIGAVASILSIVSFQYANYISDEILRIGGTDIRSNAKIQAHDLERILVNRIDSVNTNLLSIARTPLLQDEEPRARLLLNLAQDSTAELTDFYMLLDREGKLVWLSNINQTTYEAIRGTDLSYRSYFIETRDSQKTYYSNAIDSNDNIARIYVARPIIDEQTGDFKGIVAAGIVLGTLGQFLQNELSPEFESSFGMIDRNGIILYSSNQTLIGRNVFSNEFQSPLPVESKQSFNDFLSRSIAGGAGVEDVTVAGLTSSIAYQPIMLEGEQFGTLYVVSPHQVADNVSSLVNQQRIFSTIVFVIIVGVAISIGVVIVMWNRRLEKTIDARTVQLRAKSDELKRSYDSLSSANKRLEVHDNLQKEFINIAAHELRTPTQAILGYAELLQMDPKDKDEMIRAIYRNSVRLQRLTSDILDVTRIESDSLRLEKEDFAIKDVVQSAIEDTKNQSSNGRIRFDYDPKDITVTADKGRITQVILNLLDNAVKFTQEGTIAVSTERDDSQVIVSVKDTGVGVDSVIMPRLFSKFATRSEKGTGLGLFISRSIVEAHDGRIWCGNNSDGRGATFAFSLPTA